MKRKNKFYRCIYRLYVIVRPELEWNKIAISVIQAACLLGTIIAGLEKNRTAFLLFLIPFVFIGLFSAVLHFYINKMMNSSGGKYIYSLGNNFKKLPTKGLYKLTRIKDGVTHFRPAKHREAKLVTELYDLAYRKTPWDYDTLDRNRSHLKKNDQSIMLICTKAGNPIGFTHVIAVNIHVWHRYKSGEISDSELDGNEIVPPVATMVDEQPHGIILFTVALAKQHEDFVYKSRKKYKKRKDYQQKVSGVLTKAAAYHVDHFLQREFQHQHIVPVLFQTMRDNVANYFKDHVTNKREYSKDNARIICFDVENPHATPLP